MQATELLSRPNRCEVDRGRVVIFKGLISPYGTE